MDAKGLSQRELADVLGVSLDRVKSLTAGRVKKLAPDEAKALVEKLQVRGHYLATGEVPIFQSKGEVELASRLDALGETSRTASALELPPREGEFVRDVLYGVAIKSSALICETIENYVAERLPKKARSKGK